MTPKISVLMSVYNETLLEVEQSIISVLNQTHTDFECIIVIDKPDRIDAIAYIKQLSEKDSRIILLVNEQNIGLEMSMNRAATIAKGVYLVRMDADDICELS